MDIQAIRSSLEAILPFRALFLQETNVQIRYNACHERGWTDSYTLLLAQEVVGYGSVKGKEQLTDRDTVFEFYLMPAYRHLATAGFAALVQASGATFIECQSNDPLLSPLLYEFAQNVNAEVILFEDHLATHYSPPGVRFRPRREGERLFAHQTEPIGDYVLEWNRQVVATGGFLRHYNFPFADLFMEVVEEHRQKGWGTYLLQEVKKECYRAGRVPAARCAMHNKASRAALLKAGLKVAGYLLAGSVKTV
ncbi:hypothetical protein GCM10027275_54340 [Rhabdobacter roseus]|uniref:GNAT superfamily N-acetyltransferase n=1 Tax=Rhabdobacter roseus TaxID=1655419 RepID=A0A840U551_9BACT|nr:GNAT family N-acetyltransferase [Rhabdobacter roseus]MBB5287448.1 GNAT superfamily N-acetyltransferase [Rhabdobacter roseus]